MFNMMLHLITRMSEKYFRQNFVITEYSNAQYVNISHETTYVKQRRYSHIKDEANEVQRDKATKIHTS